MYQLIRLGRRCGYSNGSSYAFLEHRKITVGPPRGCIPVFGKYKDRIEAFPYNPEGDYFTCPEGKQMPFKKFDSTADGGLLKLYRAAYQDCHHCPQKSTCMGFNKQKQIPRTS